MPELIRRRDVDFLLFDWLGADRLVSRPRHAEHTRDTLDAALDLYQTIATEQLAPHNRKSDEHEPRFDGTVVELIPEIGQAVRAFAEAGLIGATHEAALGGMQLPHVVERAGMAFAFAANVSTATYPMLTISNANLLLARADAAIIDRYVPAMLRGDSLGTMCLSEPNAGSSLADITTRAVRQADGRYRLFGNKMWISGGEHEISPNIIHLVLAKIVQDDGRLPGGVKGISLFVVPKFLVNEDGTPGARNDIALAGLNHKMGYRGATNCLLNFGEGQFRPEGAAGAIGTIVGQPGEGLAHMFHMMNEARISVGLGAVALGYAGYLQSLEYARVRRQGRMAGGAAATAGPVPIIEHADVRRMLLAQKAYVEGGLALSLYCARLVDDVATGDAESRAAASTLLDLLTPIAKSWPSQWCLVANELALQIHGGYGYTRDFPVEQLYRDNRLNMIHEGTHGIQAQDLLGRKVRQNDGAAVHQLGRRIAMTIVAAKGFDLAVPTDALARVWHRTVEVTRRLDREPDARRRLANATVYLEAFGHVVVAWLWLEQAIVAAQALQRPGSDDERNFLNGKRAACEYFYTWELPKTDAWLALLETNDRTCLDMRAECF